MSRSKLLVSAGLMLCSLNAAAGLIDFEGFPAGTIIDDEYFLSQGVTVNGVNTQRTASNVAVIFDTNNVTGGDTDLAAPFVMTGGGTETFSPGNVLILHEHPDDCDSTSCTDPDDEGRHSAGYFEFVFTRAVSLESIDFFDVETNETTSDNEIRLFSDSAFSSEILADTYYTPDTGGDNHWAQVGFGGALIQSLIIEMKGSGAIDNIRYSEVPAPATILLLTLGLAGTLRSRRSKLPN